MEAVTVLSIDVYKAWRGGTGTSAKRRTAKRRNPAVTRKRAPAKWWKVLGVAPSASSQEIKAAYRARMHESHPDKVAHLSPALRKAAEREARRINDAYERACQQ
jgi:DnaJ-domain-containing protein 1